jgi:agmatine deiminase
VGWTKWGYNELGKAQEYRDLLIADTVPGLLPIQDLPHAEAGMILEGGSIDVNGCGSLLTTESCLLHPSRNPTLSRGEIEKRLRDFLGVSNVLWLKGGIAGDDTDGHVDDVARFVSPRTVVAAVERDPTDENYSILQENLQCLRAMRGEEGGPLEVLELPMPAPILVNGRRMAASYANFYIANNVVLVPTYAQFSDRDALGILQECFPGRRAHGIDCRELIYGYGAIHCSTMQQPRG